MNRNKGITLIALIITIVIMLILLAVGAGYMVNDNLVGRANKTVKAANNKVNQQQTKVDDLMEEFNKYSAAHDWQYTDETRAAIKCICDDCKEAANSTEGRILYIGQQMMYTSTGTGTSKISGEKSGVSQGITDGKLTAADFGTDGEQTINKDSNTKWVVLGAKDSNNDGTNETILLTTLNPTTEKITLYGAAAYNNCITEINRMCKELYGEEAEGMTIEDVNNCLGYTNPKGMYYGENNKSLTVNDLTTKLNRLPIWNDIKRNHKTPDGVNTEEALGEYPLDGYGYVADSTVGVATKTLIFGTDNSYGYWLASRGTSAFAISGCAYFGPGAVGEGNAGSCNINFSSSGSGYDHEFGLRPVVSLTSKIPEAGEILVGQ